MENKVKVLNDLFNSYSVVNRIERLYTIFDPEEILYTSSFGTESAYLLHLISRICPTQKVHFINTGYHFKETIDYKDQLTKLFGLNLIEIHPEMNDHNFTRDKELWKIHPNKCCYLNKVRPVEKIDKKYRVWLSGLKQNQSASRYSIKIFENKDSIIKFHPIFDQSEESINEYLEYFGLPPHPLKEEGYGSIGCYHCTAKGMGRDGRWSTKNKTECGLHFDVSL